MLSYTIYIQQYLITFLWTFKMYIIKTQINWYFVFTIEFDKEKKNRKLILYIKSNWKTYKAYGMQEIMFCM